MQRLRDALTLISRAHALARDLDPTSGERRSHERAATKGGSHAMSKRHFEEAARYIRERLAGPEHAAAVDLICYLGLRFNPRFDALRFRIAAGDGEELARPHATRASA